LRKEESYGGRERKNNWKDDGTGERTETWVACEEDEGSTWPRGEPSDETDVLSSSVRSSSPQATMQHPPPGAGCGAEETNQGNMKILMSSCIFSSKRIDRRGQPAARKTISPNLPSLLLLLLRSHLFEARELTESIFVLRHRTPNARDQGILRSLAVLDQPVVRKAKAKAKPNHHRGQLVPSLPLLYFPNSQV